MITLLAVIYAAYKTAVMEMSFDLTMFLLLVAFWDNLMKMARAYNV